MVDRCRSPAQQAAAVAVVWAAEEWAVAVQAAVALMALEAQGALGGADVPEQKPALCRLVEAQRLNLLRLAIRRHNKGIRGDLRE